MKTNDKKVSEITNNVNTEKTFTNKVTGVQITESELSDLLNESSAIKASSTNSEYNYLKIANNLKIVCQIIGYSLSDETINKITNDKKNFAECKTKAKLSNFPDFSTVKSRIRMKVREYMHNKEISDKAKQLLKKFIF